MSETLISFDEINTLCHQDMAEVNEVIRQRLQSDVALVNENGPSVARRVRELGPGTRVLFMSGYPGNELVEHGVFDESNLVQKPFTSSDLIEKVRETLDAPGRDEPGDA